MNYESRASNVPCFQAKRPYDSFWQYNQMRCRLLKFDLHTNHSVNIDDSTVRSPHDSLAAKSESIDRRGKIDNEINEPKNMKNEKCKKLTRRKNARKIVLY